MLCKRIVPLFAITLLTTVAARAVESKARLPDASLGQIEWLAGSWAGRQGDTYTEEHWIEPKGGLILELTAPSVNQVKHPSSFYESPKPDWVQTPKDWEINPTFLDLNLANDSMFAWPNYSGYDWRRSSNPRPFYDGCHPNSQRGHLPSPS